MVYTPKCFRHTALANSDMFVLYSYIGYKARRPHDVISRAYPDATYNFQDQYAKAIDVRLDRKDALSLIFRSYVATSESETIRSSESSDTNEVQSYAKFSYRRTKLKYYSQCSDNSLSVCLLLVFAKYLGHTEICYFGSHLCIQQDIACFKVPMYHCQP